MREDTFVVEVMSRRLMERIREKAARRYDLHAFIDGWKIYDRGECIVTVHGPNLRLAGSILRMLQEEALASQVQPCGRRADALSAGLDAEPSAGVR